MLNLYWKSNGQSRNLVAKPFKTEADFETYVFKNQDLLGDIFILGRQIQAGNKTDILDMLGVDQDSRICIIEMKNVEVNEDIVPQVLRYAMWAETNPDSIKAIWLEAKNRPEDLLIEWDALEVRIIVVAPAYRGNVLKMSSKIDYPVDLVELQRFSYEEEEFVLVETLQDIQTRKTFATKVKGDWTWEYYEQEHGKETTQEFRQVVEQLEAFVQKMGWNLPYNLNKYYTGFKLGNKVVFDVGWESTRTWKLHMKLAPGVGQTLVSDTWEYQRYDAPFKNAIFRLKPGKSISLKDVDVLLKTAYQTVSGLKE